MMSETPGLMTFDEWAKLPAEDRHRYNLLVQEIQQLQADNAKLRAEVERLKREDMANQYLLAEAEIGASAVADQIKDLEAENARLRAALHLIEAAVLPVQTELGMVAVEDVQDLIDIAHDALKGGAE